MRKCRNCGFPLSPEFGRPRLWCCRLDCQRQRKTEGVRRHRALYRRLAAEGTLWGGEHPQVAGDKFVGELPGQLLLPLPNPRKPR